MQSAKPDKFEKKYKIADKFENVNLLFRFFQIEEVKFVLFLQLVNNVLKIQDMFMMIFFLAKASADERISRISKISGTEITWNFSKEIETQLEKRKTIKGRRSKNCCVFIGENYKNKIENKIPGFGWANKSKLIK
jgi:hypothetical protein